MASFLPFNMKFLLFKKEYLDPKYRIYFDIISKIMSRAVINLIL